MLTSKDLMIGDWYAFRGHPYKCTASDIAALAECEEKGVPTDISEILLTAEILEKNGFTKAHDEVEDIDTYLSNYFQFFLTTDGGKWWLSIYDSAINVQNLIGIRFIHELQHALRICGIEKEIEL